MEVKKEVGRNDTMNLEVDDSDGEDGVSDSSSSMPQPVAVVRRQHNESTPVTHHTKRKRVDVTTPSSSSSRQQPVYQQQQQAQSEPRDDPDMLFFKSLLPYMRSMDMATKVEVQCQIMMVIKNACAAAAKRDDDARDGCSTPSGST